MLLINLLLFFNPYLRTFFIAFERKGERRRERERSEKERERKRERNIDVRQKH